MVKHSKALIAKLVETHKEMLEDITKHGKAAIHAIEVRISEERAAHDKQVHIYELAIAKLNKEHDEHKVVFVSMTKKAKKAIHMTKHYLKLAKIARHEAIEAHLLAHKYLETAKAHKKDTAIAIDLYKKWSLKAKVFVGLRKEANAASVKAIAASVAAEATYAAKHAEMLIA